MSAGMEKSVYSAELDTRKDICFINKERTVALCGQSLQRLIIINCNDLSNFMLLVNFLPSLGFATFLMPVLILPFSNANDEDITRQMRRALRKVAIFLCMVWWKYQPNNP